nr:MAG TPA: hypothetical protein [Caudoviricetes sp.]
MDKLTYEQVKKLYNPTQGVVTINYQVGGEAIPVQLKTQLSLVETSAFVDYAVLGSFTEDGDYNPEYQELMMFVAVLRFLSNVPLPETEDSECKEKLLDLAALYELMNSMGLISRIRAMYNSKDEAKRRLWKLFDRLECMVLEKLEFRRQQMASK